MGARPDTWMPLYWGDYLRDTGHLCALEHGAYLLLIGQYWSTGPLPANDEKLSRIARCTTKEWRKIRTTIAAFFDERDGCWHHGRIDAEIVRAAANQERRSKAGRKAAAKRWQSEPDANRITKASQSDAPSPSPPPSEVSEPDGSAEPACSDIRKSIFDDDVPWLAKASSRHLGSVRPVVARWCNDFGDAAVLVALQECRRSPPAEPISWITARLKGKRHAERPENSILAAYANAAGGIA